MAIFHSHVKVITRGKGKSAVASAAYQAGAIIKNEYDGETHDYTRKRGVVHTKILLPTNAPSEYLNRAVLWNAVEKIEKSSNSQLARGFDIALPIELTREQNIALARDYVSRTFVEQGMCVDLCVHEEKKGNPHMHIMLTMRPFNEDGTWGSKQKKEYILDDNGNKIYDPVKRQYQCRSIPTTNWNERANGDLWRKAWEDMANAELERLGFDARIDRRTYAEQGIEKIPSIHMGVAAMQMEQRGIITDRGNINREIAVTNNQLRQLRARVIKVKTWLDENKTNTPPTLYEVLNSILHPGGGRTHYQEIADLKLAAKTLMFIQRNNISDLIALADKVDEMHRDCNGAYDRKKKTEKRAKTLDEHLANCDTFKKNRKVREMYDALNAEYELFSKQSGLFAKSKAEKAHTAAQNFYEEHRAELTMYATAEKYLRGVLQKRFDPAKLPIKKWRDERESCRRELGGIDTEYTVLKSGVQNVETLKRFAVKLMIPDEPQERSQQKSKSKGLEI